MPADTIMVLPNTPAAVGMRHPAAEPLAEGGTLWPLDSFTCRRLADESIRRAEVEAAPAPAGKGGKAKAAGEAASSEATGDAPAA